MEYDLGILSQDLVDMSPEEKRRWLESRVQHSLIARRPAPCIPIKQIVEVVSYCGAECSADEPLPIQKVSEIMANRIS